MKNISIIILLIFAFLLTGCFFTPRYNTYNTDYPETIESDVIITNYTKEDLYYSIFEDTYITTTDMNTFLNQSNYSLNYLHSGIITYDDNLIAKYGDTFEYNGRDEPLYKDTIKLYKNNPLQTDNLKPGTYKFVLYRKKYVKENQSSFSKLKKFYIKSTTFNIKENKNITININSDYSLSVY